MRISFVGPALAILISSQAAEAGTTYTVGCIPATGITSCGNCANTLSCDLATAVTAANGATGATIGFDPSLTGPIYLSAPLSITASMTISGNLTISSTSGLPVVQVSGSNPTLTISGVTLNSGSSSAAVSGGVFDIAAGGVVATNVALFGSASKCFYQGGAVYVSPGATFSCTHCLFSGNAAEQGGAIYNKGGTVTLDTVQIENGGSCLGGFAHDLPPGGGGIYATGGTLSIDNSTLYSNQVDQNLALTGNSGGQGGATYLDATVAVTMQNVTIYENFAQAAGGGIWFDSSSSAKKMANFVTLSGNNSNSWGGGIYAEQENSASAFAFNNAIIFGNLSDLGNDCYDQGDLVSGSGVIGDGGGCGGAATNFTTPANPPALQPFALYEGSTLVETLPPLWTAGDTTADNGVIYASNHCGTGSADANGVPRPQDGASCDYGAVELIAISASVSPTSAAPGDTVTITLSLGKGVTEGASVSWSARDASGTFISSGKSPIGIAAGGTSATDTLQVPTGAQSPITITLDNPSIGSAIPVTTVTIAVTSTGSNGGSGGGSSSSSGSSSGSTKSASPSASGPRPYSSSGSNGRGCNQGGAPSLAPLGLAIAFVLRRRRKSEPLI